MFVLTLRLSTEAIECIGLQHIRDKKLKGQIVEREKLFGEAAETATKVQEVCLLSRLLWCIKYF